MSSEAENLSKALSLLSEIDRSYSVDGVSRQFITIAHTADPAEVQVRANRAGLVHMAGKIIQLALNGSVGSHEVFDEAGLVDSCDVPLVMAVAESTWDE